MNDRTDYDLVVRNRKMTAVKWFALAMCLATFVLYGFVAG
jgi:hypothetical protein